MLPQNALLTDAVNHASNIHGGESAEISQSNIQPVTFILILLFCNCKLDSCLNFVH